MKINTAGKLFFWAALSYVLALALMFGIVVLGVWMTGGK